MVFAFFSPAHAGMAAERLKPLAGLKGAERTARLTEEAKKEGKLVFYGSLGIDASRPLLEKFRKSHPYLAIGHYRSGEAGIYNKVANEAVGGLHAVDVIEGLPGTAYSLIQKGLVASYRSPESQATRPEFIDPKHVWHSYSYLVIGLGYNKTRVKDSEAPKSYEALLDPRWKGNKMSLDTEDADIFGILLDIWGEDRGVKYFRKLAKQDILFRRGHTLQTQLLVAGESTVAPWLYSHRPLQMMEKEAPIGLVFLEPVISLPKMLMLADKAPHPYAAALFIDWMLSEKGQNHAGMVMGRSPVRKGQEQKYKELDGLNTRPITPDLLGPNYNRYVDLYRRIFGLN
jgi:iron(III) transport system substrate-binding protein